VIGAQLGPVPTDYAIRIISIPGYVRPRHDLEATRYNVSVGIGKAFLQPILLQISADAMSRCACCPT
jgi:hypothetical protein